MELAQSLGKRDHKEAEGYVMCWPKEGQTVVLLTPKHLILGILSNFYFFCSLLFSYPSFPPNQRL